jgi:hypothetical protein
MDKYSESLVEVLDSGVGTSVSYADMFSLLDDTDTDIYYGCEHERLSFIIRRDDIHVAVQFAITTMRVYRTQLLHSRKRGFNKPSHASLPEFRKNFIMSILAFKKFIKHNG